MDAALKADFGAAALPRLDRASGHFADVEQVGGAAQVFRETALRKGAKAAAEVADVRVVDVPADDVRDVVADPLASSLVGESGQECDLGSARAQHRLNVLDVKRLLRFCTCESAGEGRGDAALEIWRSVPPRHRWLGGDAIRPAVAWPGAKLRVGKPKRRRQRRGGKPRIVDEARIDRQARQQRMPGSGSRGLELCELGPWSLRIDVVRRHGRDATPVVDTGLEQSRKVFVCEIRRRLQGDIVGED